jgi:hypothetical protein
MHRTVNDSGILTHVAVVATTTTTTTREFAL